MRRACFPLDRPCYDILDFSYAVSFRYLHQYMVLERVKERGIEYLKSKGLTTEDGGRVIGIFFFAKYITFLSMIPLCYKLRPIRRLLRPTNTEKAREYFISRRSRFQQGRVATIINSRTKGYRDWLRRNETKIQEQKLKFEEQKSKLKVKVQAAQSKMQVAKKQLSQYMNQKKEEQKLRLMERMEAKAQDSENSWSVRIYKWTEKVANKAAQNEKWKTVAKSFKVPPKEFAYAVGEGLVFYKITSPIWMPLELYGIVKYLQWRRMRLEKK